MPIYDYQCDDCGSFTGWAPMSQATTPIPCPVCSGPGKRVISAPSLARMDANVRKAMNRNEQSAHAPGMVRRGCGCSGAHTCAPKTAARSSADEARKSTPALQAQTKANARPWMLGH
jgi:putative FmdB family regulatory protein